MSVAIKAKIEIILKNKSYFEGGIWIDIDDYLGWVAHTYPNTYDTEEKVLEVLRIKIKACSVRISIRNS